MDSILPEINVSGTKFTLKSIKLYWIFRKTLNQTSNLKDNNFPSRNERSLETLAFFKSFFRSWSSIDERFPRWIHIFPYKTLANNQSATSSVGYWPHESMNKSNAKMLYEYKEILILFLNNYIGSHLPREWTNKIYFLFKINKIVMWKDKLQFLANERWITHIWRTLRRRREINKRKRKCNGEKETKLFVTWTFSFPAYLICRVKLQFLLNLDGFKRRRSLSSF